MQPGTITAVSASSLQGAYRPQARIYYHHTRHGVCYLTLTKPLRCRSRARAVSLAREWINSPEFESLAKEARDRIAANPDNTI